jgi:hypothetical protein
VIDIAEIEKRIDRAVTAAVPVHPSIAGASPENVGQVLELAKLMAVSRLAVPAYLRGNPGDCLSIVLRAIRWQMDPFFVAEKSYAVKNFKSGQESVAFESQLIHAVIETLAPLKGRLRHEIIGEGDDRRCKISGTFKGESKPHEFTSERLGKRVADIGYKKVEGRDGVEHEIFKGSPLWLDKPEVQMFYDASRDWARLYCPDVLAGAYSRDELPDSEPVDVTPKPLDGLAQRLRDAKKARVDRGFDAAEVARVGASIINGSEADDGRSEVADGDGERSVAGQDRGSAKDQKRGAFPRGKHEVPRKDAARKPTARAKGEDDEEEPGLPFQDKPAPKGKRR